MRRSHWRGMAIGVGLLLSAGCWKPILTVDVQVAADDAPALEDGRPVTVKRLAHEIDALERHIECYGSIVPKRADVWGQARLTMHRQEFERELQKDLPAFQDTLQGWLSRRDQAFLANAFSLKAALEPGAKDLTITNNAQTLIESPTDGAKAPVTRNTVLSNAAPLTPTFVGTKAGSQTVLGVALEPTLHLSQKARYLSHLHQLRRINEGDDNADAPGYALNLVRIPVSILTGSHTDHGYGAEVAVTANPHLTPDLLPTTFRNLVIQDLIDLGTVPLAHAIGAFQNEQQGGRSKIEALLDEVERLTAANVALLAELRVRQPEFAVGDQATLVTQAVTVGRVEAKAGNPRVGPPLMIDAKSAWDSAAAAYAPQAKGAAQGERATRSLAEIQSRIIDELGPARANVPIRQRGTHTLMPPSQITEVFDAEQIARLLALVYRSVKDHVVQGRPYHLDVRAVLGDELKAAFDRPAAESHRCLWDQFCVPELAAAVRTRNDVAVARFKREFLNALSRLYPLEPTGTPNIYPGDLVALKPAAVFAWGILVATALLEERLVEDMHAVKLAKGGPDVSPGMHFHGPAPCPEACQLFNDYVRARWPLYVFALDPVTEDQNVADDYSQRREMQLAVALAFATGQINASSMTRYVRRIERDQDTIALNRTVVGYSHGDNTFGWRFYPRFQSPPIRGTLSTLAELISPPNDVKQDLRNRRLENGQRECVALVVMPSFVPYMDLELCSHWFKLNDPKFREWTMADAMRISRRVQAVQAAVPRCADAGRYRGQDVALMAQRVEQLAARLPLQHQQVNVPYENTTGGFRLFSSGITDLSPDLIGWYGAPGIDPGRETTLFLVGDNFSVDQTRVVAGGVKLEAAPAYALKVDATADGVKVTGVAPVPVSVDVISRQILRVTVPPYALPYKNLTVEDCVVDVHVATPYGVTRHLTVPVVKRCPEPAPEKK